MRPSGVYVMLRLNGLYASRRSPLHLKRILVIFDTNFVAVMRHAETILAIPIVQR